MGGNVTIDGVKPEPIKFDKKSVLTIRNKINSFFEGLSDAFLTKHQWPLTVEYPYVGSSAWFMDDVSILMNAGIYQIGDIDIQIPTANKEWLRELLKHRNIYGNWTIIGTKAHGNEISVLITSSPYMTYGGTVLTGHNVHQIDFQFVDDPGSATQIFLHSSPWFDLINGFKGAHHKILLNAIGLDEYKFSITHGLRRRDTEEVIPLEQYGQALFSYYGIVNCWSSFIELNSAIIKYLNKEKQVEIFNKFVDHCDSLKHLDSEKAIDYLRKSIFQ